MHWVIQHNMFEEEGFEALTYALVRGQIPFSVVKVIPFADEFEVVNDVPVPSEGPVIAFGATSMSRIAEEKGWNPGFYFNELFDFRIQREQWPGFMLNEDAVVAPFGDLDPPHDSFFLRPVGDNKEFAGTVQLREAFYFWQQSVGQMGDGGNPSLTRDTLVMASSVKTLLREWRVWIIGGWYATGSEYRRAGKPFFRLLHDAGAVNFAQEVAGTWSPHDNFVLDIAEVRTEEGREFKVIEAGCLNWAGFYAADMNVIVQCLEDYERVEQPIRGVLKVTADAQLISLGFVPPPKCGECHQSMVPHGTTRWACSDSDCPLFGHPRHTGVYPCFEKGKVPRCEIGEDGKAITCLLCGRTSHHPDDVKHRFCANCKVYFP